MVGVAAAESIPGEERGGRRTENRREAAAAGPGEFRIALLLAVFSAGFSLFLFAAAYLGGWPLLDPDESLFAAIAREMGESGRWWIPTYQKEPFLDRPAAYFWCLRGAVRLLGESEFAYRVPNLVFGAATALATGWVGWRLFGSAVGAAAALCLLTTPGFLAISLSVGHDAALTFFSTASVGAGLTMLAGPQGGAGRVPAAWTVGLGVMLAGAVSSKGLLGFVLPILALGPIAWAAWRPIPLRAFLCAGAIAAAVGGVGYAVAEWEHPGYLRYFLYERHLLGFTTSTQRHGGQSRLVYVAALALGGAPWVALVFGEGARIALLGRLRDRLRRRPEVAGVVGWFAATCLFFFLAGSTNPTYLIPAAPPAAILAGWCVVRWIRCDRWERRWTDRYLWKTPAATAAAMCVVWPAALAWFNRPWGWTALGCGAVLLALTAFAGWFARRAPRASQGSSSGERLAWLGAQAAATAAAVAIAAGNVLGDVAMERSAKSAIAAIRAATAGEPLPVLWFNGAPASARFYGDGLNVKDVYFHQMQEPRREPAVVAARRSRAEEAASTPLVRGSRPIAAEGRYRIWICGERAGGPARQAGRAADALR